MHILKWKRGFVFFIVFLLIFLTICFFFVILETEIVLGREYKIVFLKQIINN